MPTYIGNNEVYEKYIGGKNVMGQFIGSDAVHLNHHKENGVDSVYFKSLGYPIDQWKIVGNTVQNGTPDPTLPIPVQGVGDRTANLFDIEKQTVNNRTVTLLDLGEDKNYPSISIVFEFSNAIAGNKNAAFIDLLEDSGTHHYIALKALRLSSTGSADSFPLDEIVNDTYYASFTNLSFRYIKMFLYTETYCYFSQGDIKTAIYDTNRTDYEPYGYKIPVSCGGTTQTVYLDKPLYGDGTNIDYLQRLADGTGVEHRAWREYVFDGSEYWSVTTAGGKTRAILNSSTGYIVSNSAVYSTHYRGVSGGGGYPEDGTAIVNVNGTLILSAQNVETTEEWKAYLAAQYAAGTPVTVIYQLETPTDTPIPKGKSYGENLTKVDDYMYNIVYNEIDSAYAKEFIRNNYFNIAGACSSVRKGNFFGRNYDWKYDKTAYYIVNVTHEAAKYSSIGIAGGFSRMTNDFAESGQTSDLYRVLPYATLDGINEKGVVANINVVPAGDKGRTTGTIPTGEHRETLCQMSLVRYVLDNFATAQDAVDDIVDHVSVYAPNVAGASELHLMIADANNTFVIEFINNQTVVRDMESYYDGRTYMTNFYLDGTTVNSDNHINFSSVTDYGSGLERYNIISDGFNNVNSVATMTELMTSLNFTNAYQSTTSPAWNTEFVSEERGLTVHSASNDFEPIVNAAIAGFADATRNGKYWITCHTSVYDIQTKKMYLIFQENSSSTQREIAYRTYQSTISSIPAIETATQENTLAVDTTVSPSALSVVVRGGDSVSVMQNVFVDAHGVIFTTADGVPFGFEEV